MSGALIPTIPTILSHGCNARLAAVLYVLTGSHKVIKTRNSGPAAGWVLGEEGGEYRVSID